MSNLNLTLSDNFPYPSEVFFADEEVPRDYSERFNFSTKLRDTISITTSAINQRVIHVLSAALNMEGEISESVNRISMQLKSTIDLVSKLARENIHDISSVISLSTNYIHSMSYRYDTNLGVNSKLFPEINMPLITNSLVISDVLHSIYDMIISAGVTISDKINVTTIMDIINNLDLSSRFKMLITYGLNSANINFEAFTLDDKMTMGITGIFASALDLGEKFLIALNLKDSMSVYDHITRLFSYFYTATIDMIEGIRKSIKSLLFSEIPAPEEVRFNDDEIIQDTREEFNLDRDLSDKLKLKGSLKDIISFILGKRGIIIYDDVEFLDTIGRNSFFSLNDSLLLEEALRGKAHLLELIDHLKLTDINYITRILHIISSLTFKDNKVFNYITKRKDNFYPLDRYDYNVTLKLIADNIQFNEIENHFNSKKIIDTFLLNDQRKISVIQKVKVGIIRLKESFRQIFSEEIHIIDYMEFNEKVNESIILIPQNAIMTLQDVFKPLTLFFTAKMEFYDELFNKYATILYLQDKLLISSSIYRIMQYSNIFDFVEELLPENVTFVNSYDVKWVNLKPEYNTAIVYPLDVPADYIGFGTEQFSTYKVKIVFFIFGGWKVLEDIIYQMHKNVEGYIGGTDSINMDATVWAKIKSENNLQSDVRGVQKYEMTLEVRVYSPLKPLKVEDE